LLKAIRNLTIIVGFICSKLNNPYLAYNLIDISEKTPT
jgi:hypothetical protein